MPRWLAVVQDSPGLKAENPLQASTSTLTQRPHLSSVINRTAACLLLGASLAGAFGFSARATSDRPVRWNTGGAVGTTSRSDLEAFFVNGEIKDRALADAIRNSGWTAEELQFGLTKTYAVEMVGLSRFLHSEQGEAFLKDQTRSYLPYWSGTTTATTALRAAIVADAVDGAISSAGIIRTLPVDFRLADDGVTDGRQNVCAPAMVTGAQATSLLSWYVFLPACIQANAAGRGL